MVRKASGKLGEADGHQLAADMLREIQTHWEARQDGISDADLNGLWRRDDSEILRRYLNTVTSRNCPALEHGFFAVLTDFIGVSKDSTIEPKFYEKDASHG